MSKSFKVSEVYADASQQAGDYGAMVNYIGYGYTLNADSSINIMKWRTRVCCIWPDRIEVYTSTSPKDGEHGWLPRPGGFDFNVKCAPRSVKYGKVAEFEMFGKSHLIPRGAIVYIDNDGNVTHTPLREYIADVVKAKAAVKKVREILMVAAASARLTNADASNRQFYSDKDVAEMALDDNPDIVELSCWKELWRWSRSSGGQELRPPEDIKRVINNFINRNRHMIYQLTGAFE